MISWARSTFKSMCGLVKTTRNDIVELLMGLDIEKLSKKKIEKEQSGNGRLGLNMKNTRMKLMRKKTMAL